MAQHTPIEKFSTLAKLEQTIRATRYFKTSMKFEPMPLDYNETPTDEVYLARRAVGKNKVFIEVHTEPDKSGRVPTNIYLVS